MAKYRQVHVEFWQDGFVLDLTPEEKYFYIYLMTNSKTTQCGIYELPKRIMETETGYNRETIDKLLNRFVEYGKILYDDSSKEIMLINWLKYNTTNSPKVIACIKKELLSIKTKAFRNMALTFLKENGHEDGTLYRMANKSEIPRILAAKIFERDGKKCLRCKATEDLTIDHIFPRAMGGSNAETNLRVLCRSCNSKRATAGQKFLEDLKQDGLSLDDFDRVSNPTDTVSILKGEEEEKEEEKEEEREKEREEEEIPPLPPQHDAITFYQNEIGILSPFQIQELEHWIKDFNGNEDVVIFAIKIALDREKRSMGFVKYLLKQWFSKNLKTLQQVVAFEEQQARQFAKSRARPVRTEQTPEWLEQIQTSPEDADPDFDYEREKAQLEKELQKFKE